MKKLVLGIICIPSVLAGVLALAVSADNHEGSVEALVTPKLIAITAAPNQLDYGLVEVGVNDARPTPAFFTVTNVGSVDVDLSISGDDTTNVSDATVGWTLGSSAGVETYVHRFTINPSPTLADFSPLTTSPSVFALDVPHGTGAVDVRLSMATPTQTAKFGQQSAPVTVMATENTTP